MNDADRAPIKNSPPKPQKPSIALAHRQLHQSIGAARCKVMDSAGKLKRKTIYSPVSANAAETPIERDPTLAKLRYLDETTSTTDEDEPRTTSERRAVNGDKSEFKRAELDYDGTDQRKRRVLPPFEKCSPSSRVTTTRQPTARLNVQQQHNQAVDQLEQRVDFHDIDQDSDDFRVGLGERDGQRDEGQLELNEADLEEVYLCTCCGVTKPLDPAMKFIPMFRNLFLFTNFLVFALGLAGLGMGLWFRIDPKVYEIHKYIETQNFTLAGWIMLFAGFLACIMALVAFCSISKHPVCLLTFYSIVMTLLTISSIGSLVLLTVYGLGNSLERFLNKEIYEQIRRRTMSTEVDLSSSSDAAQFLDFVQVKLRCCGAQDFRDYQKLGMIIPTTCYTIAENYINAPGCGHALRRLFDIRAGLATGFMTGAIVVQLASVVLASLMICSIYNWRATSRPASAASYTIRTPVNG